MCWIMPPHLVSLGLISSHNDASHNFDTSAWFGSSDNIGEVLENSVALELKQASSPLRRELVLCPSSCSPSPPRAQCNTCGFALSSFPRNQAAPQVKQWKATTSSVSTALSSGESFARNMWNPLLGLVSRTDFRRLRTLCCNRLV